ncbi:MAG: esterase [Cyanobacteriota bacterium]|nr:esterase [Cyanobacteriota bacterium]
MDTCTAVGEAFSSGPEQASQRLVLLHGWGADADDLLELGELLAGPAVQVVALRAPAEHPAGFGRQWYDLQQPGWPELPQALVDLRARLAALAATVPLAQTVLLGFSQGAAMALDVACDSGAQEPLALAGLIGCSGYPHPDLQSGAKRPQAQDLKVLLTHGEQDPVVPHGASVELERLLKLGGAQVELLSFSGGHTIEPELFGPIRAFMARCWA